VNPAEVVIGEVQRQGRFQIFLPLRTGRDVHNLPIADEGQNRSREDEKEPCPEHKQIRLNSLSETGALAWAVRPYALQRIPMPSKVLPPGFRWGCCIAPSAQHKRKRCGPFKNET